MCFDASPPLHPGKTPSVKAGNVGSVGVSEINKAKRAVLTGPVVSIQARPSFLLAFRSIFQAGFLFPCEVGCSIEDLLLRQLGLERKIVDDKVSTVFLDGHCVDHMAKAILTHGSTVAFSSALPGLAGATLRRDGLYAGLRSPITYREEDGHICPDQGIITVKLFNLLMDELGPKFLSKGFAIEPSSLMRLLHVHADEFPQEVVSVAFDGKRIEPERLMEKSIYGDAQYVIVSVDTEESRTKIISRSALTP